MGNPHDRWQFIAVHRVDIEHQDHGGVRVTAKGLATVHRRSLDEAVDLLMRVSTWKPAPQPPRAQIDLRGLIKTMESLTRESADFVAMKKDLWRIGD